MYSTVQYDPSDMSTAEEATMGTAQYCNKEAKKDSRSSTFYLRLPVSMMFQFRSHFCRSCCLLLG